jgi:hypothetical protein
VSGRSSCNGNVNRPRALLAAGVILLILATGSEALRAEPGPTIRLNPPGERQAAFEVAGRDPARLAGECRGGMCRGEWWSRVAGV